MDYKKKQKYMILIIITSSIFSLLIIETILCNLNKKYDDNNSDLYGKVTPSDSNEFDILDFWESEMGRVNQTDLNLELGSNIALEIMKPLTQKKYEFKACEVFFDSPNWVGAIPDKIRLNGYLIFPKELKATNPGCICMHGINADANETFELAVTYLLKGFIVLSYSHPGHGESEGALPSPSNWFWEGRYNESAHYYLSLCGAIQALRVLETIPEVDNSRIFVSGISYGGLNAMWLASICGERIAGVVPLVVCGDIKKIILDPTKLLFWIFGKSASEIPDSYWEKQNLRFDPIYFLKSPKLPPIMWQFGTNDEYFHYRGIPATLDAVSHNNKSIQIYPNGHHLLYNYENNIEFFINYIINNGPVPPKMNLENTNKEQGLFGDILKLEISVDSTVEIESVQVCYRYLDILASRWELLELKKKDGRYWRGTINPGIISSNVDYFIIVRIKGEENVWFSSTIYIGGFFISNFTIPFFIMIIAAISIPTFYLLRRRFKKNVQDVEPRIKQEARKMLIIELFLIGVTETLFFISLFLPWAIFENETVVWTHIYIFNNLMTWELFVFYFTASFSVMFLMGCVIYALLSIVRPKLAGFLQLIYPITFLILVSSLAYIFTDPMSTGAAFGTVIPGIGLYLMFFCAIFLIIIGIWKRKYQIRLGIRKENKKLNKIDKWLRFKKHI